MAQQLTFDLPVVPALGRDDFMVTPANEQALALVENWRGWPLGRLLLTAPPGAGKSHLAHVFAGQSGGVIVQAATMQDSWQTDRALVIEGIDAVADDAQVAEAVFHAINHAQTTKVPLLLTARTGFRGTDCALADLGSRIDATARARIEPPDDALLAAVLVKHFADRQIKVSPALISWLTPRMERSLSEAAAIVDALDRAALAAGVPISRKLAASVLDKRGGVAA